MKRPSRAYCFMETAEIWSKRGTCPRGIVGVVLVKDNRIISIGYVGSPPNEGHCYDIGCLIRSPEEGCIRTIHAEINAILFAARQGISTEGTTLYTTLSPCFRCCQVILSARISEVIYLNEYRDTLGLEYLKEHGVQVSQYMDVMK